jgi:hypothetical protein
MRQHAIDLMPASIRARTQAGQRTGRLLLLGVAALFALVVTATHSIFMLSSAQEQLFTASSQAEEVFGAEARASELKSTLKKTNAFIDLYDRVALPVHVSAVMATVINNLPESVTLDEFNIDAGARVASRSPRAKGEQLKDDVAPRVLRGEVFGFAASDQQIAELVTRLNATGPFRDVTLDFSRTRDVSGRDAREFRLSFKIDLDSRYDVEYRSAAASHTP